MTAPTPDQLTGTAKTLTVMAGDAYAWAADAVAAGFPELAGNLTYLASQYRRLAAETTDVASLHRTGVLPNGPPPDVLLAMGARGLRRLQGGPG